MKTHEQKQDIFTQASNQFFKVGKAIVDQYLGETTVSFFRIERCRQSSTSKCLRDLSSMPPSNATEENEHAGIRGSIEKELTILRTSFQNMRRDIDEWMVLLFF